MRYRSTCAIRGNTSSASSRSSSRHSRERGTASRRWPMPTVSLRHRTCRRRWSATRCSGAASSPMTRPVFSGRTASSASSVPTRRSSTSSASTMKPTSSAGQTTSSACTSSTQPSGRQESDCFRTAGRSTGTSASASRRAAHAPSIPIAFHSIAWERWRGSSVASGSSDTTSTITATPSSTRRRATPITAACSWRASSSWTIT